MTFICSLCIKYGALGAVVGYTEVLWCANIKSIGKVSRNRDSWLNWIELLNGYYPIKDILKFEVYNQDSCGF